MKTRIYGRRVRFGPGAGLSPALRSAANVFVLCASVVAVVSGGCSPSHPPTESEDPGLPVSRITLFAGRFELFIDHDFVVRGQPVTLNVHISDWNRGDPILAEDVRLVWTSPDGTKKTDGAGEDSPPGIWTPEFRFDTVGEWKLRVEFQHGGATDAVDGSVVSVYADEEAALEAGGHDPHGITLLKPQMWAVGVGTAVATTSRMGRSLRVPGRVVLPPGREGHVLAPVSGHLREPVKEAFPTLGSRVMRDAVVARIEPPAAGVDLLASHMGHHELEAHEIELSSKLYASRAEEIRAEGALRLTEKNKARVDALAPSGARAAKDVESAAVALASAKAALEGARATRAKYEEAWKELHDHPLHTKT
ncbi:MAG: hypothetical protein AAF517_19035, partial [Planctomycetota bacterium]